MKLTRRNRARATRAKDLVGFLVGGVHFAVDIHRVAEIILPTEFVEVPTPTRDRAPARGVIGVTDHRDEVVAILSLRERLGLQATAHAEKKVKWVIVRTLDRALALVVDAVTGVYAADPATLRKAGALTAESSVFIERVYSIDGVMTFVMDVDAIATQAFEFSMDALLTRDTQVPG